MLSKITWKVTEKLDGKLVRTKLMKTGDKVTGIHHAPLVISRRTAGLADRRTRRWCVPLRTNARAVKAEASICPKIMDQMRSFFRLSGGLDKILRESEEYPEMPAWLKRHSRTYGI